MDLAALGIVAALCGETLDSDHKVAACPPDHRPIEVYYVCPALETASVVFGSSGSIQGTPTMFRLS